MDKIQLPKIEDSARTPLIDQLLAVIEQLKQQLEALTVENRRLKKLSVKPKLNSKKSSRRKKKRSLRSTLSSPINKPVARERIIHETKVIEVNPNELPAGSQFKGYRYYSVQDIRIQPHNTRFKLARWELPTGTFKTAELPCAYQGYHYGPLLRAYVLHQYHQQRVTQPLLLAQLREWGITISSGELSHLLTQHKSNYHQEKEALLHAGLKVASILYTDDTGARHQGELYYCTYIGNEDFAHFETTHHKNRFEFLRLLQGKSLLYCLDKTVLSAAHSLGVNYYQCWRLENLLNRDYAGERCFTRAGDIKRFLTKQGVVPARLKLLTELSLTRGLAKKLAHRALELLHNLNSVQNYKFLQSD